MARIFVSHSSQNNAEAVALQQWLASEGWDDLFLDFDPAAGIAPGERWTAALNREADRCQAVIFIISQAWRASQWCLTEMYLARRLNKRMFGILVEEVKVEDLPSDLTANWQMASLAAGNDHIWFDIAMPISGEPQQVSFSQSGLRRLKTGLTKAGLDASFFAWPPEEDPKRPPYRGMRPMEAEDAGIFFGRDAPIVTVLDRLRGMSASAADRCLVILGASGAGKSSFLRAGILPRLTRDDRAFLALKPIRPGRGVISGDEGFLASLDSAFRQRKLKITRAEIKAATDAGAEALAGVLQRLAEHARPDDGAPPAIIVPVDQAEELFGGSANTEAEAFLTLLAALMRSETLKVIALFTIRTDAYAPLQSAPQLGERTNLPLPAVRQETFSLPQIPMGAYGAIIEGPARRLARTGHPLKIAPALTAALLAELESAAGKDALPLLALTLERLMVDYGGDGDLTLADYQAFGGMRGAVDAAVAEAMGRADGDPRIPQDPIARETLLREALIPWLAGIDPATNEPRRRIARYSEIPESARPLVEHFVEARLLSTDQDRATGERTVEPAHEALLRQWGLLKGWLDDEIGSFSTLEGVRRAARDWLANGRRADWLAHQAGRLEDAERLRTRSDFAAFFEPGERDYLAAARSAEDTERSKDLEEARKLAEAEQQAAERLAQVARLTKIGAIAALLLAAIAAAFGWFGLDQAGRAREQSLIAERQSQMAKANAAEAEIQRAAAEREKAEADKTAHAARDNETVSLAALSQVALATDHPTDAVKLAIAAWPRTGDEQRPELKRTIESLSRSLPEMRERLRLSAGPWQVNGATFSTDGKKIVTASADGLAHIWDATTGAEIVVLRGHTEGINTAAFSPDGKLIVTASWDKSARIWNASSGAEVTALTGHAEGVVSAAFSPDGRRVVTASHDKTARIWDVATGRLLITLSGHEKGVNSAEFSSDGMRIVTSSDDTSARVWNASDGSLHSWFPGDNSAYYNAARFSPDGTLIAASGDNLVHVWKIATHEELAVFRTDYSVMSLAFSPDGTRIAVSAYDKRADIWNWSTKRWDLGPLAHEGPITSVAFSPDGKRLVTASWDETARVWDIATGGPEIRFVGHSGNINSATFSPDGSRAVTASDDGTARIWNAKTGAETVLLKGHQATVQKAVFSPDGLTVATVSDDKTLRFWNALTGAPKLSLASDTGTLFSEAYSPNGKTIVTGSMGGPLVLWDTQTGASLRSFLGHEEQVRALAFSPDGHRIVSGSRDTTVRIWDAEEGTELLRLTGHDDAVISAAFSPDGRRVATASWDKTARIWDANTGEQLQVLQAHAYAVSSVAFSPDGQRILTASGDRTIRIWDATTGAQIMVLRSDVDEFWSASLSPDGKRVLFPTAKDAGIRDISTLEPGDAFTIACQRLGNNTGLTDVEARYGLSNLSPICGANPPMPLNLATLR